MKAELHAVLFDLDGTLIDTAPDFAVVVNQLRQRYQRDAMDYATIRAQVSHGARALVTLALDILPEDEGFEEKRQELLALYSQHLAVKTRLFAGMTQTLNWIEQQLLPWGIVTNKPRRYAEPILAALGLSERCQTLVCPDDVTNTKPDPEPMFLACQQIHCAPEKVLYLGDHRRDIDAGKAAGMPTIATRYGYIEAHDPAESWQADFIVDHAGEIPGLLAEHFQPIAKN